jgi:hypothetical protein
MQPFLPRALARHTFTIALSVAAQQIGSQGVVAIGRDNDAVDVQPSYNRSSKM